MDWNEDLHRKLQELKAATDPAEKKRLVDEAIALAKRPTTLDDPDVDYGMEQHYEGGY